MLLLDAKKAAGEWRTGSLMPKLFFFLWKLVLGVRPPDDNLDDAAGDNS